MTPKRMPVTLMILLGLLGLGVLSNVLTGALLSAAIGGALLFGLIIGNDGVRKFMQFLAVIQILWNTILIARTTGAQTWHYGLWIVIGIVLPVFLIWTLSRPDVREWMFRKNFNLDEVKCPADRRRARRAQAADGVIRGRGVDGF